jgi:hypothetical protein
LIAEDVRERNTARGFRFEDAGDGGEGGAGVDELLNEGATVAFGQAAFSDAEKEFGPVGQAATGRDSGAEGEDEAARAIADTKEVPALKGFVAGHAEFDRRGGRAFAGSLAERAGGARAGKNSEWREAAGKDA